MAQGYVPIQTITLTGTASSIDFVNIPQNYTDLKLLISSRNNDAGFFGNILLTINDSVSSYTNTFLQANGSSIGGGQVAQMIGDMNTSATTSNLFNNIEVYIPNYSGSTYKFFSADSIGENNGSQAYIMLMANTWAVTSAITKISLTNRNGGVSFVANTSVTLYGIGAHRASGGTITADSQYTYHTFTSSGTFTALEKIKGAEVLCIAGGGAGGGTSAGGGDGGGGGAGGVSHLPSFNFVAGTSYTAIVGAGGSGQTGSTGNSGSNSMFLGINSIGGGGGGGNGAAGTSGGSGGGGGANFAAGGSATQGSSGGAIGYGNNGGSSSAWAYNISGGGGAGGVGVSGNAASGTSTIAPNGGIGLNTWSSWASATSTGVDGYYAGGGAGGKDSTVGGIAGQGGRGGGGNGGVGSGSISPVAGTTNTGGGGGGGGGNPSQNGAAGGSGIVIIRYPN